jgi:hypothetical protein
MMKGLSWALLGVNGKIRGTGKSISHIRLLFRRTLHLLVVKVNIPFKMKLSRAHNPPCRCFQIETCRRRKTGVFIYNSAIRQHFQDANGNIAGVRTLFAAVTVSTALDTGIL